MKTPFHERQRFRLTKIRPTAGVEEEIIVTLRAAAGRAGVSPSYLKVRLADPGFYEKHVLEPDGTWYILKLERVDRLY